MALYAVSDLHVSGPDDPLYGSLLRILSERAKEGDTVVLAGDLFDLFIGNKGIFKRRYHEFLEAAEAAGRRGVRIHYIEGNHDFHLRGALQSAPGMAIHSHAFEAEIGGRRFHFAHGDLADRRDYGYRALRGFLRSPIMKALVTVLPGTWVDRIGHTSSQASSATRPRLPERAKPGRMEYLRNVYRSYAAERLAHGCDFVVMGHCHDLDEKSFIIDGRPGQYVNVGYPRAHGSFLSWQPGDEKIMREKLP